MALNIKAFVLGPIENNTYLAYDEDSRKAVLVDPSAPSREVITFIEQNTLQLDQIWITHAHFDHIGGVKWFQEQAGEQMRVMIHPDALPLWQNRGGAGDFGFDFDPGPPPEELVRDNDQLSVGAVQFSVLHTPGHTPGHLTFYSPDASIAFCGDLIFYHGVGRTDLEGSDISALADSIYTRILTLPGDTVLYPGHGPATTVEEEKHNNPLL